MTPSIPDLWRGLKALPRAAVFLRAQHRAHLALLRPSDPVPELVQQLDQMATAAECALSLLERIGRPLYLSPSRRVEKKLAGVDVLAPTMTVIARMESRVGEATP